MKIFKSTKADASMPTYLQHSYSFFPSNFQGSKNKKFQITPNERYKNNYSVFHQNQIIVFEMEIGN